MLPLNLPIVARTNKHTVLISNSNYQYPLTDTAINNHSLNKMSDSKDDDNANNNDNNNGIQTFLRIRPAAGTTYFHRDDIDLNSIAVKLPKHSEIINNSRSGYSFSFGGGILDEKATQKEVFLAVGKPALRNALGGYNSTIFA